MTRSSARSSRPTGTGKDYSTNFVKSLPEDTRFMLYGPDPNNLIMMTVVVFASSPMRHSQNWTPDFTKILTRGVKGIREEAQAKLAALSEPRDIVYKKPFLDAVIMTCDAMTTWSRRYAQLARELAAKEPNPQRKQELLEIADVCEWVPENPARTFREALQSQWWVPAVQPHRADLLRHGTGPYGPIPVAVLPEGHGRGPDHEGVRDGVAALSLAEHGAVHRGQDEPRDGGRRGRVCQVRGRRSRRPDAGRQGRDQRPDTPHPRIDACAVAHVSRTVHPDPRQDARQPFASRRGSRQGRQGIPKAAERRDGRPLLSRQRRIAQGGSGLEHLRLLRKPPDQPGNERHGLWRHQLRFGRRNDLPQRETQGFQGPSVRSADRRSADLDEL